MKLEFIPLGSNPGFIPLGASPVFIPLGASPVFTPLGASPVFIPLGASPVFIPLGAGPVFIPLGVSPVFIPLGAGPVFIPLGAVNTKFQLKSGALPRLCCLFLPDFKLAAGNGFQHLLRSRVTWVFLRVFLQDTLGFVLLSEDEQRHTQRKTALGVAALVGV